MKNYFSSQTDLVLIQEASLRPVVLDSFNYFKSFVFNVASTFEFMDRRTGGVATGSKANPIDTEVVFSEGELGFTTPKISLLTKYKLKDFDKNLIVVNIHAINFVTFNLFKDHIDRTFNKLQYLMDNQSAIIFAGDFNSWNKDRYEYMLKNMSDFNLKAVFSKTDKRTKAPIISNFIPYFNYHLDHIFIKNIEIKYQKVHNKIFASDHFPLFVKACF